MGTYLTNKGIKQLDKQMDEIEKEYPDHTQLMLDVDKYEIVLRKKDLSFKRFKVNDNE